MKATIRWGKVRAPCPDCKGAITTFENVTVGGQLACVKVEYGHFVGTQLYNHLLYSLLECAGCGRGALAVIREGTDHSNKRVLALSTFYPYTPDNAPLPNNVPDEISNEYREAELCASIRAWRGASALLRSTLEKTLKANGYKQGSLASRIDEAASDGVITAARQKRAHDNVRVLGNDILHDDWRPGTEEEYSDAHHYVQRILEDFYDQRDEVEATLNKAGRLSST